MRCIAHRGFAAVAPENTVPAVRAAVAAGADAVEVDVRRCGSGEPVVIHDATVDRVTESSGPVDAYTADELAAMNVLGSGAGVPTLATVLEAVPSEMGIVLEFKEVGLAADVRSCLGKATEDVVVSSFETGALAEVAATSALPRALLVTGSVADPIDQAVDLGCSAIHVQLASCDETFVERAHDAGLDVAAWTVETRAEARRLRSAGVDGVIADSPACCLR